MVHVHMYVGMCSFVCVVHVNWICILVLCEHVLMWCVCVCVCVWLCVWLCTSAKLISCVSVLCIVEFHSLVARCSFIGHEEFVE